MVTSETEIANMALTLCGHSTITSLDNATNGSSLCKLHYANARDGLLRSHPWNFAVKRLALASVASPGVPFEYTYKFALPDDCLKVIRTSDEATGYVPAAAVYGYPGLVGVGAGNTYRIEGRYILTNSDTMSVEYIARITDVTQFDTLFVEALSYKLAALIGMALTDNASLVSNMTSLFNSKMMEARSMDAQEGTPRDVVESSGWLAARA